jgi:hypothetical protein
MKRGDKQGTRQGTYVRVSYRTKNSKGYICTLITLQQHDDLTTTRGNVVPHKRTVLQVYGDTSVHCTVYRPWPLRLRGAAPDTSVQEGGSGGSEEGGVGRENQSLSKKSHCQEDEIQRACAAPGRAFPLITTGAPPPWARATVTYMYHECHSRPTLLYSESPTEKSVESQWKKLVGDGGYMR